MVSLRRFDIHLIIGMTFVIHASLPSSADEVLPKHIDAKAQAAIRKGLDFLARTQSADGAWHDSQGGRAYPVALTSLAGTALLANGSSPTRGRYAKEVRLCTQYLVGCSTRSGLLTGPGEDSGQPMHGHGFALMYLASVYGMQGDGSLRNRTKEAVEKGIALTASSQSGPGGWTYTPGSGDEGSVTVTQVQALRAAHNSGFLVPQGTIENAVRYIERCETPEGGIAYSLWSQGEPRLPISAAAVATLYNAGEYDAPIAERCLKYVTTQFRATKEWQKGGWHDYYCHLYASQAFYMAGDEWWDDYFPEARDHLLKMQNQDDGSWDGDYIGKTYGTAIALIILQLPYKYLPVFQR
jgi:hypothetical protein